MDRTRQEHIKKLFAREGFNALVCRTPEHVVMFTGYQPILGETFCLVSLNSVQEVEIRLAVPADEERLVPAGIAAEIKTFAVETMEYIGDTIDAVREPLSQLFRSASLGAGAIVGHEGGRAPIIPGYTQVGIPGFETRDLLHLLLLGGDLRDATTMLDELAAIKTAEDVQAIQRSEAIAVEGFLAARNAIRVGAKEADIAAAAAAVLIRAGYALPNVQNVQPYVHVMAGERAALAYKAFNLTSNMSINEGDTVLVQMEIGINGYWAELTRTFFVGTISEEWQKIVQACVVAQQTALQHI